ncbi:MAG: anaerobic glycerol-3-phosphate dehydrogenase subunit C [Muribaculaceae bacterium]|nr:anaerobic glycerol-3-phosphate dehydrogenase subunit C [Muribaculaceae bacterium]MDE6609016.1 anaerobic glycerol-3-phosphate dehydrogenase subunit C [Muribaculaceae bacterium]
MIYQDTNISTNNFEQCKKCTICTVYCPVTIVNPLYPGPKLAGPDGERYRLKNARFFNEALKYCLNCKRCEVACPSNVRIGDIIQSARLKYSKSPVKLRDIMLASTDVMGTVATHMAPVVNTSLRMPVVKKLLDATLAIDSHRTFPSYASQTFVKWFEKEAAAKQDSFNRHVAYFHGCYVNYNYPALGRDFVKVMNACGIGVRLLEKERCCGVAKIVNRMTAPARRDAAINLKSIRAAVADRMQVVGTSSTCILTMRDEYPNLLGLDNADVADCINLASRYLFQFVDEGRVKLAFRPEYRARVAYHAPCHMEKLGWTIYSTSLLRMIPGLEFVSLPSQCCGLAGTYGFKKENYKASQEIGRQLFDAIQRSGVDTVATDCETCKWQIEQGTGITVRNPISIIAEALDVEKTRTLNNI